MSFCRTSLTELMLFWRTRLAGSAFSNRALPYILQSCGHRSSGRFFRFGRYIAHMRNELIPSLHRFRSALLHSVHHKNCVLLCPMREQMSLFTFVFVSPDGYSYIYSFSVPMPSTSLAATAPLIPSTSSILPTQGGRTSELCYTGRRFSFMCAWFCLSLFRIF